MKRHESHLHKSLLIETGSYSMQEIIPGDLPPLQALITGTYSLEWQSHMGISIRNSRLSVPRGLE
jgi:hypothetical protein